MVEGIEGDVRLLEQIVPAEVLLIGLVGAVEQHARAGDQVPVERRVALVIGEHLAHRRHARAVGIVRKVAYDAEVQLGACGHVLVEADPGKLGRHALKAVEYVHRVDGAVEHGLLPRPAEGRRAAVFRRGIQEKRQRTVHRGVGFLSDDVHVVVVGTHRDLGVYVLYGLADAGEQRVYGVLLEGGVGFVGLPAVAPWEVAAAEFAVGGAAGRAVADAVLDIGIVLRLEAEHVEKHAVHGVFLQHLAQDFDGDTLLVVAADAGDGGVVIVKMLAGFRDVVPLGVL